MTGKSIKKVLSVLLIVALLAACGAPAQQGVATPAGVDDMSSIIRMTQDWPTFADPARGSLFSDTIALVNIYSPLIWPDLDGNPQPHIATSWTVSDDGLEYTFTIRDDVIFHSGNRMTAHDVAFSMNRMLTIGEGFSYLWLGIVNNAEAIDDTTVVFTLNSRFGPFVSSLIRFFIVDEAVVRENIDTSVSTYGEWGDFATTWLLTNSAGSGPYRIREFRFDEFVMGERFEEYFQGWEPDAPEFFILSGAVDPVSVRTAMSNRQLEITDEVQPIENLDAMGQMDGVEIVGMRTATNLNMMLHTRMAPTDCVHFRRAMAYAFDYDTVLNDIVPGSFRAHGPVPSVLPGHDPSIEGFRRNLDNARAELEQSIHYGNPDMMNVTLTWCTEVPIQERIALLFMANMAEIGIGVEVTGKPFGAMVADASSPETTPNVSFVNVSAPFFEAGAMLQTRYHSSSMGTWEQMEWLGDPEVDRMIEEALATTDMNERFERYKEIQRIIFDLSPTIWVFDHFERRALQASYVEWNPHQFNQQGIEYTYPMGFAMYVRDMRVFPDRR